MEVISVTLGNSRGFMDLISDTNTKFGLIGQAYRKSIHSTKLDNTAK